MFEDIGKQQGWALALSSWAGKPEENVPWRIPEAQVLTILEGVLPSDMTLTGSHHLR